MEQRQHRQAGGAAVVTAPALLLHLVSGLCGGVLGVGLALCSVHRRYQQELRRLDAAHIEACRLLRLARRVELAVQRRVAPQQNGTVEVHDDRS